MHLYQRSIKYTVAIPVWQINKQKIASSEITTGAYAKFSETKQKRILDVNLVSSQRTLGWLMAL